MKLLSFFLAIWTAVLPLACAAVDGCTAGEAGAGTRWLPAAQGVDTVAGRAVSGRLAMAPLPMGPRAMMVTRPPYHGTATVSARHDGRWTYVPEPGFVGDDAFTVSVSDGVSVESTRLLVSVTPAPGRRRYYVSARTGSDTHPGTRQRPLASLQAAHDLARPGDTVYVMNGRYGEARPGAPVLRVTRSGLPGAVISYRALAGHRPVLAAATAPQHVSVQASHIHIEGLTIDGAGPGPVVPAAQQGITVSPRKLALPIDVMAEPREVAIVGNVIGGVAGGAIVAGRANGIVVSGNTLLGHQRHAGIQITGSCNVRVMYNTSGAWQSRRMIC